MATFTSEMTEQDKIKIIKDEILSMAKTQLGPLFKEGVIEETLPADSKGTSIATPDGDTGDNLVLANLCTLVIQEALDICNMSETSGNLKSVEAMCIQALVIAYQNRGVEGLASQTELGQKNEYISWIDYLRTNLIKSGKRYVQ